MDRGGFDRGSTAVVGLATATPILGLLIAPLVARTLPPLLQWGGVALMVGGLAMRVWAFSALGRFYTRTLRVSDQQTVVTAGPYRYIRHPGYLGMLALWIGAGLAAGNAILLLIGTVVVTLAYLYRMDAEEAMLVRLLGDDYRRYRTHTRRLIPLIY